MNISITGFFGQVDSFLLKKFEVKYIKLNRNIELDIKETHNLFKNLKIIK